MGNPGTATGLSVRWSPKLRLIVGLEEGAAIGLAPGWLGPELAWLASLLGCCWGLPVVEHPAHWGRLATMDHAHQQALALRHPLPLTIYLVCALAALGITTGELGGGLESLSWVPTAAEIVASPVTERGGLTRERLLYTYEVDGVELSSNRLSFGLYAPEWGQEDPQQRAAGNRVTAFYDPAAPERSVLVRGAPWEAWLGPVTGAAVLLIVTLLWISRGRYEREIAQVKRLLAGPGAVHRF